jgi:hypothetical protein
LLVSRCDLGDGCRSSELVDRVRISNHETRGKDTLISFGFGFGLCFSSGAVASTGCIFSLFDCEVGMRHAVSRQPKTHAVSSSPSESRGLPFRVRYIVDYSVYSAITDPDQ